MIRDVRFALRALLRTPVFTTVSVLMLGVGIGLSIFMFGAINVYSLRPLPFPEPDRLVHVDYTDSKDGARRLALPHADWLDYAERQTTLQSLAGYSVGTMNLGGIEGAPERLSGAWISAEAFATLGIRPMLGRDLAVTDAAVGADPVALIGHRVWQLRFNSNPGVIGTSMRINGTPTRIIGVMPERFAFPLAEAVWMPLSRDRASAQGDGARLVNAFGRLRDGVSREQAGDEFAGLVSVLAGERTQPLRGDRVRVQALADQFVLPQIREANLTMFAAVLLVLLIACANVASLVLARFAARSRELAVRAALGATRRTLIVQVLSETLVIAALAAALGYLGAQLGARVMDAVMQSTPGHMPYWIDGSADLRDVLFSVGVALAAALLAGLAPALRAGRIDPQRALRDGSAIGDRSRVGRYLVTGEVALCVILLVCAGVAIRSSLQAQETSIGIDDDGVLTGRIALFESRYADDAARLRFAAALEPRLRELPGVRSVAFASTLPLMGYERQPYVRADDTFDRDTRLAQAWKSSVSDEFFATFGIAVREGRGFDARDTAGSAPVAMVSAAFAAAAWPGRSAIGERVQLSPRDPDATWLEVVGVVADSVQADYLQTRSTRSSQRGDGNVFRPLAQDPPAFISFAMRADGEPAALAESVRQAVTAVDADLPVYWLRPMREWREQMLWGSDILANLFSVFAAFAVLLAVAGIYAVLAFDVSRRTREIGVRRALGARASRVLAMVLRRGGMQVLVGVLVGVPLAIGFSRLLAGMMMPGSHGDPLVYVAVVGVLALAVLAAAVVPVRRALRIDPMEALRHE